MTSVLVDSNVLLDVVTADPRWGEWSTRALERAAEASVLVINPLIYGEVSVDYARIEDVDAVLPPTSFRRESLPWHAAFLAGKAFASYRSRGGPRTSPLTDFYIGAHAAVARYTLLTRDAKVYRTYFPSVPLITP